MHELLDSSRELEGKGPKVNFNIMVCGPSGSGKSSFIDLFIRKFNFKVAEQLIKKAEENIKKGNTTTLNPNDIWGSLGLK